MHTGDFKSSVRYFDARIGPLVGIKFSLFFPNCDICMNSREILGIMVFLFRYISIPLPPWPTLKNCDKRCEPYRVFNL